MHIAACSRVCLDSDLRVLQKLHGDFDADEVAAEIRPEREVFSVVQQPLQDGIPARRVRLHPRAMHDAHGERKVSAVR